MMNFVSNVGCKFQETPPLANGGGGGEHTTTEPTEVKKDETAAPAPPATEDKTEQKSEESKKEEEVVNGPADGTEEKDKQQTAENETAAAASDKAEKKKKEKSKKKWSFRSISFTRKDKSKPNVSREDSKNGDLTKEEPVPEVSCTQRAHIYHFSSTFSHLVVFIQHAKFFILFFPLCIKMLSNRFRTAIINYLYGSMRIVKLGVHILISMCINCISVRSLIVSSVGNVFLCLICVFNLVLSFCRRVYRVNFRWSYEYIQ